MKYKSSKSAFIVIIIAEILGLFGLLYFKYTFDFFSSRLQSIINKQVVERDNVSKLKQLFYSYESSAVIYVQTSDEAKKMARRSHLESLNTDIRTQLEVLKQTKDNEKKDSEKYILCTQLETQINEYLKFNGNLFNVENLTHEYLEQYCEEHIIPVLNEASKTMDALEGLANYEMEKEKFLIKRQIFISRIFALLTVVLMIFTVVVSLKYSYKRFSVLENEKNMLRVRSEYNENRIEEIQNKTIIGIADLIESRSGETGQHVKRTSKYVSMITVQALFDDVWPETVNDKFWDLVTRAAPLHDIGKIVIPDAILNKQGKLTAEEFEIMKSHAEEGGRIIRQFLIGVEESEYIAVAMDIATCHHEHWDGTGYPKGLMGTQIPLSARIMAVADVFDALVSKRCYKDSMSYDEAFEFIQSQSGKKFDPQVVSLFMKLKDRIKKDDQAANELEESIEQIE